MDFSLNLSLFSVLMTWTEWTASWWTWFMSTNPPTPPPRPKLRRQASTEKLEYAWTLMPRLPEWMGLGLEWKYNERQMIQSLVYMPCALAKAPKETQHEAIIEYSIAIQCPLCKSDQCRLVQCKPNAEPLQLTPDYVLCCLK